jgi:hypothetical protein
MTAVGRLELARRSLWDLNRGDACAAPSPRRSARSRHPLVAGKHLRGEEPRSWVLIPWA